MDDIEQHNFDSAITKSRTLLEEVFCYVIEKRKENPSTFFYIKGKVPTFLPRNWHESPGCITACISKTRFPCGKPGGKSGKPRGKLGLFFTKSVENPVGKVKSSLRNGKTPPFFVVK